MFDIVFFLLDNDFVTEFAGRIDIIKFTAATHAGNAVDALNEAFSVRAEDGGGSDALPNAEKIRTDIGTVDDVIGYLKIVDQGFTGSAATQADEVIATLQQAITLTHAERFEIVNDLDRIIGEIHAKREPLEEARIRITEV